ncbi:MAG: serpin family protein, partial [Chloroflexi bacterium]|nr:serpin family protein [Chloroflexota bacterium]
MKQTHRFTMLAIALALSLAACTPGAEVGLAQSQVQRVSLPDVPDADSQELIAGNNAFAFDLYHTLQEAEENLFFSPYSISTALAMTYAGARGDTERQMADVFHFTLPQERLHQAFNALDLAVVHGDGDAQTSAEEDFTLNVANSLWGQQGYSFLPDFLDLLAENYGAGLRLVDFTSASEPARLAINEWVSDQTEERIDDLIPQGAITDLTRLVLANAIYFDAKWLHPFDMAHTRDGVFNLLDGGQVSVPMMSMSDMADLLYAQGSGYQAVELPYRGGRAAMTIIVPDPGSFVDLESALNADQIDAILANMEYASVALTLPKFSYEQSVSMAKTLADMGMPDAMDPGRADLSGMDGTQDLYITDVFHKAFVAVDEAGTEAAAATAVIIGIESAPVIDVELTVDRPFVFLIRDIETGSILFLGRVLNP